jgi:hypothetical protein
MKLTKEKWNNGYTITLIIGKRTQSSWWSSPQKRAMKLWKDYLVGRYTLITTEKRANEFERLYAKLWGKVEGEVDEG